ncbi:hypothetical protein [Ferrovibrio sp.]|uniref:hypothetical protein n=1 Tax=Ferrovibrio sp. TaxID=1917215 RepID=UPI001B53F6A6|nr:hypothetical protein [Ferrovibrio sp.]MBP7066461.1 hypothetical protein [Ferrovibrio sp.]
MKEHFLRKLAEIEKRNAAGADDAERLAHIKARRDREAFEKLSLHLDAVARPAFEAFAEALAERSITAKLRFEAGMPERAQELPPLAEVIVTRPGGSRHYALSYLLDGASYVMRLSLGGQQERRAILPQARLTATRVRGDLEVLLEAVLTPESVVRKP